jgi:protein-tyrosine phosphatase
MIDTHCHLLHALDDGPSTLDESLELASALVAAGVTDVICTPHVSRRYPTDPKLAEERLDELRVALASAGIALRVTLGAEVSPAVAIALDTQGLREVAMAGRFVLVELEARTTAAMVGAIAEHVAGCGLVPVLAHPERCRAVRRDLAPVTQAQAAGALTQVVATSLDGAWGSEIERAAWLLVASKRADIVASDAHAAADVEALRRVLAALDSRLGRHERGQLTSDGPSRLLTP